MLRSMRKFALLLIENGFPDLDESAIRRGGKDGRELTQAIAGWAFENGYRGIIYPSRLDGYECCAVFDTAEFEPDGDPEPLTLDDPDLRAIAKVYNLTIEELTSL